MSPIRVQVAQALRAVAGGQSLDVALTALQGDERDLGFARALLYQSLRHHYSASALVARLCQRAPKPAIAALLRAALTELRFLATPPHAAVAESVAAASKKGSVRTPRAWHSQRRGGRRRDQRASGARRWYWAALEMASS